MQMYSIKMKDKKYIVFRRIQLADLQKLTFICSVRTLDASSGMAKMAERERERERESVS